MLLGTASDIVGFYTYKELRERKKKSESEENVISKLNEQKGIRKGQHTFMIANKTN